MHGKVKKSVIHALSADTILKYTQPWVATTYVNKPIVHCRQLYTWVVKVNVTDLSHALYCIPVSSILTSPFFCKVFYFDNNLS